MRASTLLASGFYGILGGMDATIQFFPMMIVGFALALGLTPISRQIAMRIGVVDKPTEARKIHADHKPMMGGLAIYLGFAFALMLFSPPQHIVEFGAIVSGAGFLALIGLLDDRYNLGIRTRLLAMALAASVIAIAGIRFDIVQIPVIDTVISIIWIIAITNAANFLDNMDGLTAGMSAIAAGFFLLIAITQGQVLVSMLAAALFGSSIGFLTYNFNPASTFMGDMGALTLGFLLAVLGVKLDIANVPPILSWMAPVLVLMLPVFDINLVVWTRLREGRSPGQAGRDHTSHRLMSLGLSTRQTLFVLYGNCVLFGSLGLLVASTDTQLALPLGIGGITVLVGYFGLMFWIRARFQKGIV